MNPSRIDSGRPTGWRSLKVAGPLASLLLLAAAVPLLSGCGGQTGARADARETRLTEDGIFSGSPRFSPDGKTLAFTRRTTDARAKVGIFTMPAAGGPITRLSPDTLGLYPIRWAKDGQALYCVGADGITLYRLALDRSVKLLGTAGPLSRFADVSPDGETRLILTFNQDNYDVIVRGPGAAVETLVATPDWEQGAVFGPGPDQVTVVSAPTFQSAQTTISVRRRGGSGIKVLPLPEGFKYAPCWSADGQMMSYVASSNGQLDVWFYDAATGRANPAVQDPQDSSSPTWSPDGERLVFSRTMKTSRLFVGAPGDPNRRQLTNGPANDYEPLPSPDGTWIAFLRRQAPGTPGAETPSLCVMPAAGGEATQLDLKGLTLPAKGVEISWSEDGEFLAFCAREASTSLDIYRIRRDGSELRRVTVEPGDEVDPKWSPDGRRIAYTLLGGGETQVAVVPSNGGTSQTLSDQGVVSECAAWSPDGRQLAYLAFRQNGGYDVWITPTAAPGRKRLAASHSVLHWPLCWAPSGQHLILKGGQGTDWYYTELDLGSGAQRKIATQVMSPSGLGAYTRVEPEGEAYRSLLCPAGVVLSDGEQTGDLFMVRTNDLLKSRTLTSTGGSGLWFASAGLVALF